MRRPSQRGPRSPLAFESVETGVLNMASIAPSGRSCARELEAAARAGTPLPAADELETHTREALRLAWKASKAGRTAFEDRPGNVVMLRSLYLAQDTQPEVDRLNEKAGPCMARLLATAHWERPRGCGDAVRGYLEYVCAGRTDPVDPASDFKVQAAAAVREGVARTRGLTSDPERNDAVRTPSRLHS